MPTIVCPVCKQSRTVSVNYFKYVKHKSLLCQRCSRLKSKKAPHRIDTPCGAIMPGRTRCRLATDCRNYDHCLKLAAKANWSGWKLAKG